MKIKNIFIISFLVCFLTIHSQNSVYQVVIFKWSKIENKDVKKVVLIDSTGNILLNGKSANQKINLQSFTKSINDLVAKEIIEKIPANDEPPRIAVVPKNNEQNINFSVTYLDDFHRDKKLANSTKYSTRKIGLKLDEVDYFFDKYFKKSDLEIIKKLLK